MDACILRIKILNCVLELSSNISQLERSMCRWLRCIDLRLVAGDWLIDVTQ